MKVDVKASLGYQANGRIDPADAKDTARLNTKKFICSECGNEEEFKKQEFGEIKECQKCGAVMILQT
jgi:ribosomal protein L37AE/L43A